MRTLIKGAKIYTGSEEVYPKGDILIEDRFIVNIGKNLKATGNEHLINGIGKVVTPGLIDVYTEMGLAHEQAVEAASERSNHQLTPSFKAIDGLNPNEKSFEDARKAGVTTVQVLPRTHAVLGGEAVVVKTTGNIADEMIVRNTSGMTAAFSSRLRGPNGNLSLMEMAALLRQQLNHAKVHLEKINNGVLVTEDFGYAHLIKLLNAEYPLRIRTHLHEEMTTALRIAREFSIPITLENAAEAFQLSDFIAASGVNISIGPNLISAHESSTAKKAWHTFSALDKAGVVVSITTAHPETPISSLLASAASAVRFGLQENTAWKAITINAARHLGLSHRIGSLSPGKDADLVIWSGEPFDFRNDVEKTIINGQIVYNASKRVRVK